MKVKIDPGGYLPTRAHETDAGLDLYAAERKVIRAGCHEVIETGVHLEIPFGFVGLLTSKSGLMGNHGITSRGTIDCGYSGSIKAVLFNHGATNYIVEKGDKVTQLVLVPIATPVLELTDSLGKTERGNKGFGSSGR